MGIVLRQQQHLTFEKALCHSKFVCLNAHTKRQNFYLFLVFCVVKNTFYGVQHRRQVISIHSQKMAATKNQNAKKHLILFAVCFSLWTFSIWTSERFNFTKQSCVLRNQNSINIMFTRHTHTYMMSFIKN